MLDILKRFLEHGYEITRTFKDEMVDGVRYKTTCFKCDAIIVEYEYKFETCRAYCEEWTNRTFKVYFNNVDVGLPYAICENIYDALCHKYGAQVASKHQKTQNEMLAYLKENS